MYKTSLFICSKKKKRVSNDPNTKMNFKNKDKESSTSTLDTYCLLSCQNIFYASNYTLIHTI